MLNKKEAWSVFDNGMNFYRRFSCKFGSPCNLLETSRSFLNSVSLRAESMKKKLPWLEYDLKKAKHLEAKDQEKEAKKNLDVATKMLNELREPIEERKEEKKEKDTKCRKIRDLLDKVETSRKQIPEKEGQLVPWHGRIGEARTITAGENRQS